MPPQFALSADWIEILGGVQKALDQAVTEAAQREEALATIFPSSEPPADRDATWRQRLEQLDQHLRSLQGHAGQADQNAAEVESELAAAEEALRQWRTAVAASGQKLADWAGRPV